MIYWREIENLREMERPERRKESGDMDQYGILSLLPVAVVILLVFLTKRTTISLLAGTLVGAVMLYGGGFAKPWVDIIYGVLGSDLWIWLVLVCGFFGSLVALFEASGGIYGFTAITTRLCQGEKRTLLATWLLGILVFIDDWLSILSVGAAMRKAADRFRIPREMLAFLSSVTASSICVVAPISTWGVFMTSQLVATGICPGEAGMATFLKIIPLLFYPLLMLACGGLFALGVLPKFGPMKQADRLAKETEPPAQVEEPVLQTGKTPRVLNFLAPVLLVTAVTIATGEILYGTFLCLVFCAVLYLPQRLMTAGKYLDTVLAGFKDMVGVIFIITSAFMLRDINDLLGMPAFVIGAVQHSMAPQFLPVAAFLIVSALGFAAGNFWGICAISFPVIIPIAQALGGNLLLTAGAIMSATVASSNACFYGSEATLACSAAQIDNVRYAQTAIPLVMVPFVLSAICYLIAGLLIG